MKTLKILPVFFLFLTFLTQNLFAMNGKTMESSYKLPQYEKFTLDNGLTVYLMEQHEVPLIYLSLATPGGSIHDGDKAGVAFFTAEALHFGTKSYSKDKIEETFDFYGASFSSRAINESARISASFASKDRDNILPIIKEMIVNPTFDKTEFEKRKQRALLELKQAKESPRRVIKGYFDRFLYGNTPYGSPVTGTVTSVSSINLEDLKNFYDKNYIPNGSAIALVGDFRTSEMKSYISSLFSDWKKKDISAGGSMTPEGKLSSSRILLVNKDDATETTFLIGSYGIKQSNPDYVAVEVINTILGGR
ncbi:MAG: M16 family metallopeptidase, partial [Acidobacteriota bacterium]